MRIYPVIALAACAACALAPRGLVDQSLTSLDGHGLQTLCDESPESCQDYIMASFNSVLAEQEARRAPTRLCPRQGLLPEHVVALVKRYLEARPEIGLWEASKVIAYATVAAFPCYDMPTR